MGGVGERAGGRTTARGESKLGGNIVGGKAVCYPRGPVCWKDTANTESYTHPRHDALPGAKRGPKRGWKMWWQIASLSARAGDSTPPGVVNNFAGQIEGSK